MHEFIFTLEKIKGLLLLFKPNFPSFLSPFHMFVDTMIVSLTSKFSISNVLGHWQCSSTFLELHSFVSSKFLQWFYKFIAKIGTWKWCKTFLLNYIAELSLYLQHRCGKTDQKQTNTYPGVKSKIYLAWLIIKPNLLNWVVLCTIKDNKIEFLYTFSLKRMKTVIIPKSSQKIKVKVLHVNCSRDSLKLPNYKFHVV